MTWEAEELRRNALEMESRVRDAESRAETATTLQSEVEVQLNEARARIQASPRAIPAIHTIKTT